MTEQLQMNAEAKNSNTGKNKVNETPNTEANTSNSVEDKADETQNSCEHNTEQDFEEDCDIVEIDPSSPVTSNRLTSKPQDAIFSSTPLREKINKKKKRKFAPDVSLSTTPISSAPPQKKSKTPEVIVIDEDNFQPYDYSQTDFNAFSGKKKSKDNFKPEMQHNFRGPGKHFGRNKKHFKQGTFSDGSKQPKKKWPQKS